MPEYLLKMALVVVAGGVVLVALGLALWWLRKYSKSRSAPPAGPGWTLTEVETLHKSGQLTDTQYKDLKDVVIKGLEQAQEQRRSAP